MNSAFLHAPDIEERDLSSIRLVTYGGAPIARFPDDVVQGFVQSEATQTVCCMLGEEHRRALENLALLCRCGKPILKPILGIHVRILHDEDKPLPAGETGEAAVRGATVMAGHWNRPEATAETLRNGWLHTGAKGSFQILRSVFGPKRVDPYRRHKSGGPPAVKRIGKFALSLGVAGGVKSSSSAIATSAPDEAAAAIARSSTVGTNNQERRRS